MNYPAAGAKERQAIGEQIIEKLEAENRELRNTIEVIEREVAAVYDEITNGQITKADTASYHVLDCYREEIGDLRGENERLKTVGLWFAEIIVEGMAGRPTAEDTERFVEALRGEQ